MIPLVVAEAVGWVLLIVFIISQLIIPAWRGVKLFPAFGRRGKLQKEMVELNDEEEIATLEREIESKRKRVEAIKHLRSVQTNGSKKKEGK